MKLFHKLRDNLNKRSSPPTDISVSETQKIEMLTKLAEPLPDYGLKPGESVLTQLIDGEWVPQLFWRYTETGKLAEVLPQKNQSPDHQETFSNNDMQTDTLKKRS